MVSQTDERLLAIVTKERAEYIQPAINLAEAELRLRGVPFNEPPPVPVHTSGRKFGWRFDDKIDGKVISVLGLLLLLLSERFVWLSSTINWLEKMILAGVGFIAIMAVFEWGERLLAWWRRGNHP